MAMLKRNQLITELESCDDINRKKEILLTLSDKFNDKNAMYKLLTDIISISDDKYHEYFRKVFPKYKKDKSLISRAILRFSLMKRYKDAKKLYEKTKLQFDTKERLENKLHIYKEMNDKLATFRIYKELIKFNDIRNCFSFALFLLYNNRYNTAYNILRRVSSDTNARISLFSDEKREALLYLAEICFIKNRIKDGLSYLNKYKEYKTNSIIHKMNGDKYHYLKGMYFRLNKQFKYAINEYNYIDSASYLWDKAINDIIKNIHVKKVKGINLQDKHFQDTNINGFKISNIDISKSKLYFDNINSIVLNKVRIEETDIAIKLINSLVKFCTFINSQYISVEMNNCKILNTSIVKSKLYGKISHSIFKYCTFDKTDFRRINIVDTSITKSTFISPRIVRYSSIDYEIRKNTLIGEIEYEEPYGEINNFLKHLIVAGSRLLERTMFPKDEDEINDMVTDTLRNLGYNISDQSRSGTSKKKAGEVDIIVRSDTYGVVKYIYEALKLPTIPKSSSSDLSYHIKKANENYNPTKIKEVFIGIYSIYNGYNENNFNSLLNDIYSKLFNNSKVKINNISMDEMASIKVFHVVFNRGGDVFNNYVVLYLFS